MTSLSTTYLGIQMKNPIIVGSCGLTNSVDKVREFADNNAGAVVLKSLFEEQIQAELSANMDSYQTDYPGSFDYVSQYTRDNAVGEYLELISEAKKEVDIPIIASINCVSGDEWISYAREIEKAGADGLELNVSLLPSDPQQKCKNSEDIYFKIIEKVSSTTSLPLALKMSPYSAALANLITRLSWTNKVAGFVLFNRYFKPDINIKTLSLTSATVFSSADEAVLPLRWIAILSGQVERSFSATTGIHDGEGVIKQLLAGATTVQTVSAMYKNGPAHLNTMLETISEWMKEHGFDHIDDFRGKLSYDKVDNPAAYERIQFMKYYGGVS